MEEQSEFSVGKKEYDNLVDVIPSFLSYVETFKKICIIIDECTVENDFFIKYKKKKLLSLYLYCFGPKHKFERNGPKISFWGSNWIRKYTCTYIIIVRITFLQIQKFSDFMQFYMMQLDL